MNSSMTIKVSPVALSPLESLGQLVEVGLALPSDKSKHLVPILAGLIAVTMELPDNLIPKWPMLVSKFDEAPQADCRYFAQLYRESQLPGSGSRWDTKPVRVIDEMLDVPGTTMIYTRTSHKSPGNESEDSSIAVHWAISCGAKYVIQAFGVGEPLMITPRTTPFTMYDVDGLSLAIPSVNKNS